LLPNAVTAVSAIAIAFNVYGTLFMTFVGAAVAVGARVGNNLGANRPGAARLSAFTAVAVTPAIWVPLALVLTLPVTEDAIVSMFVRPEDAALRETLGNLLYIVAALELLDGLQTVMSGAHLCCLLWAYMH
jgi:Na+-driven multidrug efflux pump